MEYCVKKKKKDYRSFKFYLRKESERDETANLSYSLTVLMCYIFCLSLCNWKEQLRDSMVSCIGNDYFRPLS